MIPFLKREEALGIGFLPVPRASCYLTYSCLIVTPHLNSISISVSRTMICSTSDRMEKAPKCYTRIVPQPDLYKSVLLVTL